MNFTYEYPRPAVTVDCAIFCRKNNQLLLLLIQRGHYPFEGMWALPGGFVDTDEDLEDAAHRELKEETGLEVSTLEQMHTFGKPNRDPRGRTISVIYLGTTEFTDKIKGADDAVNAKWFPTDELPNLAFDHEEIVKMAIRKFSDK